MATKQTNLDKIFDFLQKGMKGEKPVDETLEEIHLEQFTADALRGEKQNAFLQILEASKETFHTQLPEWYIPNPQMKEAVLRSHTSKPKQILLSKPTNNEIEVANELGFELETEMDIPLLLKIWDNQIQPIEEQSIPPNTKSWILTIKEEWHPGLYYWQLKANDDEIEEVKLITKYQEVVNGSFFILKEMASPQNPPK